MNYLEKNLFRPGGLASGAVLFVLAGALLLLPLPTRAQTTIMSFSNAGSITINDGYANSTPFPATIQVPAVGGALSSLTVTITGLTDPSTAGIELLLVGPTGVGVDLMDFAGDGGATNINLTFSDNGTPFPNTALTTGTNQPSGTGYPNGFSFPTYSPFYGQDTTNKLAGYTGTPLTGTWSLYGYDTDLSGNGVISGGWTLTLTLVITAPSATTLAATGVTPTNATFYANVNPNGAATTFYFEYGTTTAYGQTTTTNSLSASAGPQTVTNEAALVPNTIYHYQVVAQNNLGTVFGGDETLTNAAAAPVIASVPDQTIAPESTLIITNVLYEANVPPRAVTFSLAPGAPVGALVTPSGVFTWSPLCEQGSTTNAITLWAVDNGTPALSNSVSFNIIVGPCVQVTVGSAAALIGQTTTLPVSLLTTVPLTNVDFALSTLAGRFANWSVNGSAGVTATSADPNPAQPSFAFTAPNSGQFLGATSLGTNFLLGTINVEALPTGNSSFATLNFASLVASNGIGAPVTNVFGLSGRVVLIAAQPLLDTSLTNRATAVLTLYGNPGSNYVIQTSANIIPPVTWTPFQTNTLTTAIQYINLGVVTNAMQFFRAEQQ